MRIIFIPSESPQYQQINTTITSFCDEQGHKIFDATVTPTATAEELRKETNNLIAEIKQTDGLIFEASNPSFNQGKYITLALQAHKPILLLYRDQLPAEFASESSRLITTQEYDTNKETDTKSIIKEFLKLVKKQRLLYRFNLMISKDLNSYLMDKAREEGVSKADYIRQLIVQDMDTTS